MGNLAAMACMKQVSAGRVFDRETKIAEYSEEISRLADENTKIGEALSEQNGYNNLGNSNYNYLG